MTKKSIELDQINRKILIELQRDARVTNLELANRVGLSPSACLKRVQALEAAKCIQGYIMATDLDRITHNVQAYFMVHMDNIRPETIARFERAFLEFSEVVDCMRVGGDPDFIALVVCSDVQQIDRLMDDMMAADIGIRNIRMHVILNRPKWFVGYPLEAMKWKSSS
ncbi:Lrp/AsnC family transcriptional regulator [Ensifer sp. HO-A22]|uniref:Lrp/AsnC family transcriptional regulator n=1 Tax=Ensifer oleiphilus TaxID=2742698 RepID=A0A7Y6QD09_9HYPH|nr:Lrp/AsnC family transcriptional regulator [Ensifer oleiphilus]NVD43374.1 Lrp/AsnC family transcriptional regulator [Ensifer oleiphilus]